MPNFRQPDKSISRAFVQNGVYVGTVTRVDETERQVYVTIPRYVIGFEFGPLNVASAELPAVDDSVACMFLEDRQDDIIVLGVIKNSSDFVRVIPVVGASDNRPASPVAGTILFEEDTQIVLVWDGNSWEPVTNSIAGTANEVLVNGG